MDLYDPDDAPISSPQLSLIYDVDYAEEESVDVRVWDTCGHDSKTDANGDVQWAKVFHRDHEFDGRAVLDTWRIRVFVDEGGSPTISDEASLGWNLVDQLDIDGLPTDALEVYSVAATADRQRLQLGDRDEISQVLGELQRRLEATSQRV